MSGMVHLGVRALATHMRGISALATVTVAVLLPIEANAFTDILSSKLASLKVMTSQFATASRAVINAKASLVQGQMMAIGAMSTTVEQLELYQTFSAVNGQGAQVCDAINQRNDIDAIGKSRDSFSFVAEQRSGHGATPADNYEVRRAEQQLDAYCSADEHKLGLCKSRFDGMAAASSNYLQLSSADQFTAKKLKAAEGFISNLVPPPAVPRSAASCDAGCQAQRLTAMQSDAAASMIAVPLAMKMSSQIGAKTFASKK